MAYFRRLLPETIAAQITGLVIVAVLLGVGLASAVLLYLVYDGQTGPGPDVLATVRAARIAAIVKEAETSRSTAEFEQDLARASRHGMDVKAVPIAHGAPAPPGASQRSAFIAAVDEVLEGTWGIVPLPFAPESTDRDSVLVKIDGERALLFEVSAHGGLRNLVLGQTTCALAIITFIILFLSVYAVRWITSPLSSIASAARSFGRFPDEEQALSVEGPREIAQVAEALNDMRRRVRTLVDERTKMLVAISHDLRTPLTRLRLRTERLIDVSVRACMLQDIAIVNDMLGETLAYLREGEQSEPAHLADLPSLLQTICAQFADVGHDVTYNGPDRLAIACRARALHRAVTNVVDNATKFGTKVTVALRALDEATVQIDVSDDGPGIPFTLRDKVFEPFYKGDNARSSSARGGFGLGLSIARDIVKQNGGAIGLFSRSPQGLIVRLSFVAQPREGDVALTGPESRAA